MIERKPEHAAVAALLAFVLAACGAGNVPDGAYDMRDSVQAQQADATSATAPTQETASPDRPDGRDPWQMSRMAVLENYAQLADAGDSAAAYILGSRLGSCHRVLREDTPDAVLAEYRREQAFLAERPDAPAANAIQANMERRSTERTERYADCRALPAHALRKALKWLEQAARAGHPQARRDYPTLAMSEFQTREGIIRNPLEARRRQALARDLLEAAVAAGDRQALHTYVQALDGRGPLYAEDRRTAQVYTYVRDLAAQQPRRDDPQVAAILTRLDQQRAATGGLTRSAQFETLLRDGPSRYPSDAFSDVEWAALLDEGRRIFESDFRTPPDT